MTEPMPEDNTDGQRANNSGAENKPKHAGGRPPKSFYQVPVQQILDLTAPVAARVIQAHIERKKGYRQLPSGLLSACYFVIEHAIGKAKQKIEHSGSILTYDRLAKDAAKMEEKPPPILADAYAIAENYQEKTAGTPEENKAPE